MMENQRTKNIEKEMETKSVWRFGLLRVIRIISEFHGASNTETPQNPNS